MIASNVDVGCAVFVCSKPLQFFNCASIVRSRNVDHAAIYIVTAGIANYDDFKRFILSSRYIELFKKITFCDTHADAAELIKETERYESLFVECDRVLLYQIFAPLKHRYLMVFEEGFGTYSGGPNKSLLGLKWFKWKLYNLITGSGMHFGGGRVTDCIFVSNLPLYRKLNRRTADKAVEFPGLIDELKYNSEIGDLLEGLSGVRGEVALILGTWGQGELEEERMYKGYDKVFYKPHPHENSINMPSNIVTISESWIPAEMLIFKLAKVVDKLTVYHYSSSAMFYCAGIENAVFIDLLGNVRFKEVMAS